MSKYQIKHSDLDLAKEFKKNLFENNFYHSPSLQKKKFGILEIYRVEEVKK